MLLSDNFRVEISTNKGKENLLFTKGKQVELFIKTNRVGYFYIIGHTLRKDKKLSYLLELNESNGNRKFIYFVNGDDINKWISMGKFTTESPFGVESIQVIASELDLIDKTPPVQYDGSYYKISNNPISGIIQTRGLIKN